MHMYLPEFRRPPPLHLTPSSATALTCYFGSSLYSQTSLFTIFAKKILPKYSCIFPLSKMLRVLPTGLEWEEKTTYSKWWIDQKTWGFASQYLAQVIMWKWTPQSSLPFLVGEQMISFLPLSQQAYDYPRPRPSPLHAIPREFHTSSMTASHGAWKLRWHVSLAWLLIKPHKVPTTTMSPEFSRIILLSNILSQSLPKYVFCSV